MQNTQNNSQYQSIQSAECDLKQTKMNGPTFRALQEYFDEWGEKDPTLLRSSQRDVNREGR